MKTLTIGQKVWVINNGEPVEVTIKFIGDGEVAFELDGELKSSPLNELYESETHAKEEFISSNTIVICREVGKTHNGGVAVYEVGYLNRLSIPALELRSRLNPELQYAATHRSYFEDNKEALKDATFFNEANERNDIVIIS